MIGGEGARLCVSIGGEGGRLFITIGGKGARLGLWFGSGRGRLPWRPGMRDIYSLKSDAFYYSFVWRVHDVTLAWTIQAVLDFSVGGAITR